MFRLAICLSLTLFITSTLAQHAIIDSDLYSIPKPIISKQCKDFYNAIATQNDTNPDISRDKKFMAAASGHNVNDLGDYELCHNNSNFTFKVLKINIQPEGFGYFGICGPNYCSTDDWSNETSWLLNLVPTIGGPNLSNITFTVVDPNEAYPHFGAGSYISAILMFAIISVGLGVSIYNHYFDIEKKEIPEAQQYVRVPDSQLNASATSPFAGINRLSSDVSSLGDRSSFEKEEPRKSLRERILFSFDLSRNMNDLTNQEDRADQDRNLQIFNGIKAISIFFVAFGHVFLLGSTDKNVPAAIVFAQESWWFLIVFAASYAVDVFFFVSGFLAAYVLLEKLKGVPFGLMNLIRVYLYRLFRIWPTYVFVLLFFWKIAPFFADGPIWFLFNNFTKACSTSWWKNFLLIDNIDSSPLNDHCMIWGFQIAVEFQCFIFTPFVLWLYIKHREYGKTAIWMLILISIAGAYSFAIQSNLPYQVQVNPPPSVQDIYNEFLTNPIVHWSTYFMGIYAGILYRNYKNGEKNIYYDIQENRRAAYFVGLNGLMTILFIILFPRTEQKNLIIWPESVSYLFAAAGRPLVVLGVWFAVLPALSGHAVSMRNFLSWTLWNIMATIVLPLYLLHFVVVLYVYTSATQFSTFQLASKLSLTVTVLAITIVLASLVHLFIEKPIIGITRSLLPAKRFRVSPRFGDLGSAASITKT